jgi:hypothetical protein
MQIRSAFAAAVVALSASLTQVAADHQLSFKNNCGSTITPKWKNNGSGLSSGPTLGPGATGTGSVPETWSAGRIYGQNGACAEPDGTGCTLFECSFDNGGFNQCNLSLVSGFNVGMSFDWIGGSGCQPGKSCGSSSCPNTVAWLPPDSCSGCLSQCNTPGVGMQITFCP